MITFIRLIKYAIQGFIRNFWLSFICITTISLAFISIDLFYSLGIISDNFVSSMKDKVDISIYLKPEESRTKVESIKDNLLSLNEVLEVRLLTKEEALTKFKERHSENAVLLESIDDLSENPLGDTLIVKAENPDDYQKILEYIDSFGYVNSILETDYTNNQLIMDKINSFNDSLKNLLIFISIFFALISSITVLNTIRMTIYSRRKEIQIMRFLGASNSFIKVPFLIEGSFYMILGWITSYIAFYGINILIKSYAQNIFAVYDFDIAKIILSNSQTFLISELVIGIILSILASLFTIRRYAKV
ncbi:ABC transporter permease [Patescibacteria group bacterium]|nr:ABC transporter permease [Patescibacteria group bacterium]